MNKKELGREQIGDNIYIVKYNDGSEQIERITNGGEYQVSRDRVVKVDPTREILRRYERN